MVDTLENNAVPSFAYLSLELIPALRAGKSWGAPAHNRSTCQNVVLAVGFRSCLSAEEMSHMGSTSTAHQKQTYTNKQSGGERGGRSRKGKMVHSSSGVRSCSVAPRMAAISTC